MTIAPIEPEPINWKSWKSILFRLGIPIAVSLTVGYFLIDTMINMPIDINAQWSVGN